MMCPALMCNMQCGAEELHPPYNPPKKDHRNSNGTMRIRFALKTCFSIHSLCTYMCTCMCMCMYTVQAHVCMMYEECMYTVCMCVQYVCTLYILYVCKLCVCVVCCVFVLYAVIYYFWEEGGDMDIWEEGGDMDIMHSTLDHDHL